METNLRPIFCSVEDFFFSKGRVRLVYQLLLNLKFNLWDNNAGRVLFRKPSVCVWLSNFCNHNKYISVSFQVIQILINGFMDSNFQVAYISSKMKRYISIVLWRNHFLRPKVCFSESKFSNAKRIGILILNFFLLVHWWC